MRYVEESNSGCSDAQIRIVILGSARVGKTCLVQRFVSGRFLRSYRPTVEEFYRKYIVHNGERLSLEIVDTSGTLVFPAMRELVMSQATGFVLMFAVNDAESFEETIRLKHQIREKFTAAPIVVAAGKADICEEKWQVGREIAEMIVTVDWDDGFRFVSALTNSGVSELFEDLFSRCWTPRAPSQQLPLQRTRRKSLPVANSADLSSEGRSKSHSCVVS